MPDTPLKTAHGSRKKENRSGCLKNVKRDIRNSKYARLLPYIKCNHKNETWCEADKLTTEDVIARKRINGISKHFFNTGRPKKEMRGGSRITPKQIATTEDIINFIKKLPVSPSHYGRGSSNRQYLSPELNIAKLYRRWTDECASANLPIASLQKFTKTFKNNFNLAFMPPKVDVCSYCDILEALKKTTTKRKVMNEEGDDTPKPKRGRPKKTETPKESNSAANKSEVSQPTPSTSKAIVVPVKKRGRPKKNNNGNNQD